MYITTFSGKNGKIEVTLKMISVLEGFLFVVTSIAIVFLFIYALFRKKYDCHILLKYLVFQTKNLAYQIKNLEFGSRALDFDRKARYFKLKI